MTNLKLEIGELRLQYRELVGQKKRGEITAEEFEELADALETCILMIEHAIDEERTNK